MAHQLATANGKAATFHVASEGTPWHGLGTPLDNPATSAEAITAAGLGWTVSLHALALASDGRAVTDRMAVLRDDTNCILGTVGRQWTPIQNTESFDFLDGVVGDGIRYHTRPRHRRTLIHHPGAGDAPAHHPNPRSATVIARARETRPDGHRPPTQWATLGGRTAYLLAKFWRDDRPKMADQCSTKSSVIRDIIRGKAVTPAERDQFLHGASQHHAINGQWLRTGEGTPFRTGFAAVLAPALESAGETASVPVTASPPQAAPVQATPPRERIVGVCATLWGGDRYRAQAATGIPTAIWHNLLHGHQEPTDDHLLALATLDGSPFRPEWVIDGTGSPWRDFAPPEPEPEPQPAPTPVVPPDDPHAERIDRAERRITDLAQKPADLIAAGRNAEHTTDARLSGLARELGILRDHTAGIERTIGQDRQELQSLSEAVTVAITRHDRLEARMKDYPHPHQIQDTGENISALRILMEEAFQRIDALEARPVPATTSPKPTAAVRAEPRTEADLDPAEAVTIERWFSLKGTHQLIGNDKGGHITVGKFLSTAYKQHKLPTRNPTYKRGVYRVADLRHFARWWFATAGEGQEHTHDGWLVYFARHALPAHQATTTNDQ